MTVEEATSKARDEALTYKSAAADLGKEKGLLQTELASARETFQRMKVECVNSEIARSAAEEARRKALEDLEVERARSRSFSDDVDRLKRALLEKDGAIVQAGLKDELLAAQVEARSAKRQLEGEGPIDVQSSRPPVKEDGVDRDKRRQSAEKQKLKRTLEQAQPSMEKRLKAGAASRDSGSSDPRPPTGAESAPPRPLAGESAPSSPKRVDANHPQGQEGAPEPPRSGVEADPITISDGSGGDGSSRDACPMDEEVEAFPIAKRTPWPIGVHSIEEQRRKEEREREQKTRQQPQEEQQLHLKEGEVGQPSADPQLEELLEQDRR
ncbi:neurofilament medium polypeptide-like [Sorghum bicolor]|uniref:neurofilament medium polypeptide-like n=1 Tax=Sorghum bicolor TaxID=4558 RepID=UPI000B425F5B|nr:neurofilament medium polypeptide-like [Sorghum bicolor]|eukprot:XP_021309121.1 neurofilament medium polypeptide-like [Sorghum bicolor]